MTNCYPWLFSRVGKIFPITSKKGRQEGAKSRLTCKLFPPAVSPLSPLLYGAHSISHARYGKHFSFVISCMCQFIVIFPCILDWEETMRLDLDFLWLHKDKYNSIYSVTLCVETKTSAKMQCFYGYCITSDVVRTRFCLLREYLHGFHIWASVKQISRFFSPLSLYLVFTYWHTPPVKKKDRVQSFRTL